MCTLVLVKKIVSNFAVLTIQEVTFFVSFFKIVAAFSFSPLISSGKRWQICFIYSDICIDKKKLAYNWRGVKNQSNKER